MSSRGGVALQFLFPSNRRRREILVRRRWHAPIFSATERTILGSEKTLQKVLQSVATLAEARQQGAPLIDSNAPPEPFELKGDRLGMKLADFKAKYRRETGDGRQLPLCGDAQTRGPMSEDWHPTAGIVHCILDLPMEQIERTVGGVRMDALVYQFVDDQLFRISAAFDKKSFNEVFSALTEKYGYPTSEDKPPPTYYWGNGISVIALSRGISGEATATLIYVHEELWETVMARTPKSRKPWRDVDL